MALGTRFGDYLVPRVLELFQVAVISGTRFIDMVFNSLSQSKETGKVKIDTSKSSSTSVADDSLKRGKKTSTCYRIVDIYLAFNLKELCHRILAKFRH